MSESNENRIQSREWDLRYPFFFKVKQKSHFPKIVNRNLRSKYKENFFDLDRTNHRKLRQTLNKFAAAAAKKHLQIQLSLNIFHQFAHEYALTSRQSAWWLCEERKKSTYNKIEFLR